MAASNKERVRNVKLCAAFLQHSSDCNHWFINLQHRGGSTRLDMRIDGGGGGETVYETKQTERDITGSTIQDHAFETLEDFQVKDVDRMIKEQKLDLFQFGPRGSGCQQWSYVTLSYSA